MDSPHIKQRINYFLRSLINMGQPKVCPYCGSTDLSAIEKKYFVTTLLKCNRCAFIHRHPKDSAAFQKNFYQKQYSIDVGMMTRLPTDAELAELKKENFPGQRSYKAYIHALRGHAPGLKVVDYGCSWGYDVFKLNQEGFQATGFEISEPRAAFGRKKLGVTIACDTAAIPDGNDLITNSHVIEHLPDVNAFFEMCRKKLNRDGVLMCFCPNGNDEYKAREPMHWHVNWGELHPNYLTADFAKYAFKNNPYLVMTGDWEYDADYIARWDGKSQVIHPVKNGKELLIIAKPNLSIAAQSAARSSH